MGSTFWTSEVASIGYVFYESKVRACLIFTVYPGLAVAHQA